MILGDSLEIFDDVIHTYIMETNETPDTPTVKSKVPKFLYLFPFLTFLLLVVGIFLFWYKEQYRIGYERQMTEELGKCYLEKNLQPNVIGSGFYNGIFNKTWRSPLLDYTGTYSDYYFKYPNDLELKVGENSLYFISKNGLSPSIKKESVDIEINCWKEMSQTGDGGVCAEGIVADLQMRIGVLKDYVQGESCVEQKTDLTDKQIFVCIRSSISGTPVFYFEVLFGPETKRYLATLSTDNLSLVIRDIKTIIETLTVVK